MSSSVAFSHPSLSLGNVVDPELLVVFRKIQSCKKVIESKKERLDSLVALKRSLEMTANELESMKIETMVIREKFKELNDSIEEAAGQYMDASMSKEMEIQVLKESVQTMDITNIEDSPVDFARSELKTKDLYHQSLKLDSQYFSFEGSSVSEGLSAVENYVRNATKDMRGSSDAVTESVSAQLSHQFENHSLSGTLIITASTTHPGVRLFNRVVFDPKKLVNCWNHLFKDDPIDLEKVASGGKEDKKDPSNTQLIHFIKGAVYGSSFVGMVHLVNNATTVSTPSSEIRAMVEEKIKVDSWLENVSGGFGINDKSLEEVQSMLSARNISSHISMVVMGAIPTIESNKIESGIHKFTNQWKENVPQVFLSGGDEYETIHSLSQESNSMSRVARLEEARFRSVFKGLGEMDKKKNSILDLGSLLRAFTDYVSIVKDRHDRVLGVPIAFRVGQLSKAEIEEIWKDNYFKSKKRVLEEKDQLIDEDY